MRYDDQLRDSSSDRQCGQLVAPPALYIGRLGTRYNYLPCQWPVSVQQARCPILGPWQPDIDVFVRRYARSDPGPHILHLFVKKCFIAANTVFLIRSIGVIKSTSY